MVWTVDGVYHGRQYVEPSLSNGISSPNGLAAKRNGRFSASTNFVPSPKEPSRKKETRIRNPTNKRSSSSSGSSSSQAKSSQQPPTQPTTNMDNSAKRKKKSTIDETVLPPTTTTPATTTKTSTSRKRKSGTSSSSSSSSAAANTTKTKTLKKRKKKTKPTSDIDMTAPEELEKAASRGITVRASGKWQAQLYFAGKSRYIGLFDSRTIASNAYKITRSKLEDLQSNQKGIDLNDTLIKGVITSASKASIQGITDIDTVVDQLIAKLQEPTTATSSSTTKPTTKTTTPTTTKQTIIKNISGSVTSSSNTDSDH